MEKPNPKKLSAATSIADLSDEELSEIFVRLPSYQTVIICKFVSKHWLSLLSNPKFTIEFFKEKKQKKRKALPWTLLSTLRLKQLIDDDDDDDDDRHKKEVQSVIDKHNKIFSSPKFSMNFLPVKLFKVAATFKDLVLCLDVHVSGQDDGLYLYYYICNPVTKQWVALPAAPDHREDRDRDPDQDRSVACLICEDNIESIHEYRFRVVVVFYPARQVGSHMPNPFAVSKVIVFCSEYSQWVNIDLRLPLIATTPPVRPLQVVVCEGMVCVCVTLYFGMFNPFDDVVIPPPTTTPTTTTTTLVARALPTPYTLCTTKDSRLFAYRGSLISICPQPEVSYRLDEEHNLLVDKTKGVAVLITCEVLHLKQVIDNGNNNNNNDFPSWGRYDRTCIHKSAKSSLSSGLLSGIRMINIHPRNPQLLYILTAKNHLLLCDIRSSTLKTLGQAELLPDHQLHYLQSSNNILQLQYWPTPLPTILASQCSQPKSNT